MMKKTFCMILSLLMLFSLSTAAIAASCASSPFAVSPIMQPLAVVYEDDDIRTSQGTYQTQPFTCVSGNGNSLRYWFKNNSGAACTVQLYKKTILGLAYTQPPFTVAAGSNKYQAYQNPGNTTFVIRVTHATGGTIIGELRANQLNLVSY